MIFVGFVYYEVLWIYYSRYYLESVFGKVSGEEGFGVAAPTQCTTPEDPSDVAPDS